MPEHPTFAIPTDLLPADGRFGSGPSKIDPSFVDDLAATGTSLLGTSHRRTNVQSIVGSIRENLASVYELPDGYEVVLGIGGATAFWDAAISSVILERSAHFICGEFSQKFAAAVGAAPHLEDPIVVAAEPGSAPQPMAVPGVDTVAFIHNETSTGVVAPFARCSDALVVVDGTSAAGAIPFDVTSIDVYYFSPQKALASEGGLWCALMSPKAIDRINAVSASDRWIPPFLSLQTAVDNSRKNQTYNTPSLTTLYLLERQLGRVVANGGLGWASKRSIESAHLLAQWVGASDFAAFFVSDQALRSPTVSTIDLDQAVNAELVSSILRSNGIVDTESYRKLGRNQLRIATFPNIEPTDIVALTACIDWIVARLDRGVDPEVV
jgi:phosphoserine aminotransferase